MKEEKRTQIGDVKQFIEKHKNGITSKQAIEMFGATRLSDIIFRLKRDPYNMPIVTRYKNVDNRYGGVSRVAVYKIGD